MAPGNCCIDDEGKITGLSIVTHFIDGTKATNIQTLIYDPTGLLLGI